MSGYAERRPPATWAELPKPATLDGSRGSAWQRGRLFVLSSVGDMETPGGGTGPTWLVSVSVRGGKRATDREVAKVLRDFGMRGAEEDNHLPGVARAFFMPIDPALRGVCHCKTDETTVVEADGFTWQDTGHPAAARLAEVSRPVPRLARWRR